MSKRLSLIFTAILLSTGVFAAGDYSSLWQKGNHYYTQKNFDSAAYYYNKIAAMEPDNAEVYYNLGNACYRLNDIGNAVLNYERALKYNPGHKLAADNLYLAQSRINNRIPVMPEIFFLQWWRAITQTNLANIYAIIAVLLFLVLIAYHITRRLDMIPFRAPVQVSWAVIALCSVLLVLSIISARHFTASGYAIVMQEGAPLMNEPKFGKSVSLIPEGIKVEICGEQAGWYEITLPDGRKGWLQRTTVAKI